MISSSVYDYINVLGKAEDAAWKRNEAIANNIANQDTPGYKRIDVDFESALRTALRDSRYESMDSKVHNVRASELEADIYTDHAGYSYRLDGNNVDPATEQVELAKNQIRYQGLVDAANAEFARLTTVTK